jgi:hypothetical protein
VPDELDQVLKVIAQGGTALELGTAIGFLDTVTRVGKGLTDKQHGELLSAHVVKVNEGPAPLNRRVLVELSGHANEEFDPMTSPDFRPLIEEKCCAPN